MQNGNDYYFDVNNQVRYKKRSRGGVLVVVMLLVSLLTGALGGGLTYWLASRVEEAPGQTVVMQEAAPQDSQHDESETYASLVEEVTAKAASSVVEITTEAKATHAFFGSYIVGGAGSGVVLSKDGYIVTNQHVIANASSISVRMRDGAIYDAKLIGQDVQSDLAVIKIEAVNLQPLTFADSDKAMVGETTVAIGNPLGTLGGTVTEGILSAKDREIIIEEQAMVLLQTSAAISPGNSGGGLFDRKGHLLGIVNAKSSEDSVEGIGFAIPANTVKMVTTQLIENGRVTGRPALGVETIEISSWEAMFRYRMNKGGLYISSAVQGSPLQEWDRILLVDAIEVSSVAEIRSVVSRHKIGDKLKVQIERNGKNEEVEVTLIEQPANRKDTFA